jgi:hypothetical protein
MQLLPIATTGVAAGSARGSTAVRAVAVDRAVVPTAMPADISSDTALPRSGLRGWNTQLNRQVADAQQALSFLDDAAGQLQDLRGDLSNRLAGRAPRGDSAPVADKLRRFDASWRTRPSATSGSLGPQLEFSSPQPAVQRFTVRGLDLRSLQRGDPETLSFTVSTAPSTAQPLPVQLAPGLSDDAIAQRFDQALAAANIRVKQGDDGSLQFSVREGDWPAVRDSLAVKGGGKRFPTGQFNRVRTDAEPEAVQPQQWKADDADAMRQTLQQVLQALDRVREAKGAVGGELARAGQQVQDAAPADGADWARATAQDFAALANQTGYDAFSSITAALVGVRKDRVLSLLSLR